MGMPRAELSRTSVQFVKYLNNKTYLRLIPAIFDTIEEVGRNSIF